MPATSRDQVGTIGCLCCGHEIPVKKGTAGALGVACQWCDFSGYAKKDTQAARLILGKMKPTPPAPAPGDPAPAPVAGEKKARDKIPGVDS